MQNNLKKVPLLFMNWGAQFGSDLFFVEPSFPEMPFWMISKRWLPFQQQSRAT